MKRLTALLLTVVLLLVFFTVPSFAASEVPGVEAEAYIVLDMTTGEVLCSQNATQKMYPASTTKMMTAILALENLDMNTVVTMDQEVADTGGSALGLKNGEQMSVKNLIYAMMVKSANDCAVALAKQIAGNVESFAVMMNDKAAELGCTGTHFVNPHGLHDGNHYTTAADLARIAEYCMQNETFREIVKLESYTVPPTNACTDERTVTNTNLLLFDEQDANRVYVNNELRYCKYDGCIGIKTGYTDEAQGCLVAAATQHGTTILSVVLKTSTYGRFADSIKLLDWAFENYRTLNVMKAGSDMGVLKVKGGEFNQVSCQLNDDIIVTVPQEASDLVITTEAELPEELNAPVSAGGIVGELVLYESGIEIGRYDITAAEDIAEGGWLSKYYIEDSTARLIKAGVIGFFAFIILGFVGFAHIKRRQLRKRKAARAAKYRAKMEEEARRRAIWERQYDDRFQHYTDEDNQ